MLNTALALTIAVISIIALSCLVAAMAVFIGGGRSGTDLFALLNFQLWFAPLVLLPGAASVRHFLSRSDLKNGLARLWTHVPQWLVFIFVLLNALLIIAELAFFLINRITEESSTLLAHAPLLCLLCCSLSVLALYAHRHDLSGAVAAMSGRWP